MRKLPKISVAIPTYNSKDYIEYCLSAIFGQNYPKESLEVIVVDNYSTDQTLDIARKYGVKILMNKIKDSQVSKMLALERAKGELFIYLDSDIRLVGKDWFRKLTKPLVEDIEIVASFTRFVADRKDNSLVRYLSYDLLQRDPIYEFFSPSVEKTVIEKGRDYTICEYSLDMIPPSGLCLFRMEALLKVWNIKTDLKYMELDSLVRLVKAGFTKFAYVPSAGMHHPFVGKLKDLLKKRLRNIGKNYLGQPTPRLYTWFDLRSVSGFLKVIFWILWATTLVGPTTRGLYKSIKHKDVACMWEPVVAFTETWVIIYGFLKYSLLNQKVS